MSGEISTSIRRGCVTAVTASVCILQQYVYVLKAALLERLLRLRTEIRQLKRRRPKTALLHFQAPSRRNNPARAMRERARLLQLRLQLDAQAEEAHRAAIASAPSTLAQQPEAER